MKGPVAHVHCAYNFSSELVCTRGDRCRFSHAHSPTKQQLELLEAKVKPRMSHTALQLSEVNSDTSVDGQAIVSEWGHPTTHTEMLRPAIEPTNEHKGQEGKSKEENDGEIGPRPDGYPPSIPSDDSVSDEASSHEVDEAPEDDPSRVKLPDLNLDDLSYGSFHVADDIRHSLFGHLDLSGIIIEDIDI